MTMHPHLRDKNTILDSGYWILDKNERLSSFSIQYPASSIRPHPPGDE
jgi:hypothetical protein